MKKLKTSGGFTLMEVLVSMLILTFLVIGMGPGMKTAMTVYQESTFQSSSTALIGTMNATLGDVLRYAEDVEKGEKVSSEGESDKFAFTFTNTDYGLQNVSLVGSNGTENGVFTRKEVKNSEPVYKSLLPEGSYPNMKITAFSVTYDGTGLFTVRYIIESTVKSDLKTDLITHTIAMLNN